MENLYVVCLNECSQEDIRQIEELTGIRFQTTGGYGQRWNLETIQKLPDLTSFISTVRANPDYLLHKNKIIIDKSTKRPRGKESTKVRITQNKVKKVKPLTKN